MTGPNHFTSVSSAIYLFVLTVLYCASIEQEEMGYRQGTNNVKRVAQMALLVMRTALVAGASGIGNHRPKEFRWSALWVLGHV